MEAPPILISMLKEHIKRTRGIAKMPAMPPDLTIRERTDAYIHARYQHPAWLLLASRRGPLVLSCLRGLFEDAQGDVGFDDALQSLAQALADHANHAEFDIGTADCTALARKELRDWIKRELVVERGGNLYARDALEEAMRFVEALGDRVMTSTASRLSVVQREIENVEGSLNPDPKSRAQRIRDQITALEAHTWGLQMLATARGYRPQIRALLMTRDNFEAHSALSAVVEPSPAAESPPIGSGVNTVPSPALTRSLERGRLEQEFLPVDQVRDAVATWSGGS